MLIYEYLRFSTMNVNCTAPQNVVWSFLKADLKTLSPAILIVVATTRIAHRIFREIWFLQLLSRQEHWGALLGGYLLREFSGDSGLGKIGTIASVIVEIALNLIEASIQVEKIRQTARRMSLIWNGYITPIDGGPTPAHLGSLQYKIATLIHKISQLTFAIWRLVVESFMLSVVVWKTVELFKNPRDAFVRSLYNIHYRAPELFSHPSYECAMDQSYTLFNRMTQGLPELVDVGSHTVLKYVEENYKKKKNTSHPIPSFIGKVHHRMSILECIVRHGISSQLRFSGRKVPDYIISEETKCPDEIASYQPFPDLMIDPAKIDEFYFWHYNVPRQHPLKNLLNRY